MKKIIFNLLVVGVFVFMMSTPSAWSQTCEADLNNDGEVNKLDWQYFKEIYKAERGMTDCDLSASSYPAPVEKTGQTTLYAMGDDGDLQKGVEWPNPRFIDNGDGTVTDNLTGLIWLKDANCIATNYPEFDNDGLAGSGAVNWQHALDFVTGINDGSYAQCGGNPPHNDWRLPNYKELFSLVDAGHDGPPLPSGHPFTNVQFATYWSSTTLLGNPDYWAWGVNMNIGYIFHDQKSWGHPIWPVRGGH